MTHLVELDEARGPEAPDRGPPTVVGIGASAGGLKALQENSPDVRAVAHLEEELRRIKEQLESTIVARDRTVEEHRSANQELMLINEEQKAAAVELETRRQEIQSINEELTTINQEHQSTIEELKRTNADLQNLIESTEIGTIFLERAMRS